MYIKGGTAEPCELKLRGYKTWKAGGFKYLGTAMKEYGARWYSWRRCGMVQMRTSEMVQSEEARDGTTD